MLVILLDLWFEQIDFRSCSIRQGDFPRLRCSYQLVQDSHRGHPLPVNASFDVDLLDTSGRCQISEVVRITPHHFAVAQEDQGEQIGLDEQ